MLVLVGKTCSGKDSIRNELIKNGAVPIITYTTRPQRKGEIDGVTYNFVTAEKFEALKNEGFFFETASYKVANGQTWCYGTPKNQLNDDKVIILNPSGLKSIREAGIDAIVFYICASEETIKQRLKIRGDNLEEAARRIKTDNEDFEGIENYVDIIITNNGEETPESLANAIFGIYKSILRRKIK